MEYSLLKTMILTDIFLLILILEFFGLHIYEILKRRKLEKDLQKIKFFNQQPIQQNKTTSLLYNAISKENFEVSNLEKEFDNIEEKKFELKLHDRIESEKKQKELISKMVDVFCKSASGK